MPKLKKSDLTKTFKTSTKKKRKGIHSKNRSSNIKSSKMYKKDYQGQGR
jgi:hypothetical protein